MTEPQRIEDPAGIDAALALIAGSYRTAPATRNMLLVISGIAVPLLALILLRLLNLILPPPWPITVIGLAAAWALIQLADLLFGLLHFAPQGAVRRSPCFWRNFEIPRERILALGIERHGQARRLVITTADHQTRTLPFRPGFERILEAFAESGRTEELRS